MSTLRVRFPSVEGHSLAGRLDLPTTSKPRAFALFAHCFTCSKDLRAVARIARTLTAHGIAVLRFDFTGLGASEGEFADTTFSSNTDDLVAAAEWLAAEHEAPSILIGHSLGGAAVLRAAERIPSSTAVVTIGAPAEAGHVARMLVEDRETIEREGSATVQLAGRRFCIRREFLEDLEAVSGLGPIATLRRALLVMHSPLDKVVGIQNAKRIYTAAKHPKSFVTLDDADHLLTSARDAEYAARMIAVWVERYLDDDETAIPEPGDPGPAVPEGEVHTATGSGGFRTEVKAGRHRMIADEPASVGGTDEGPTPYGYLLAALGACTSMTLRMYAERKGWPLEEACVHLTHAKVHALDSEGRTGRIDRIERTLELRGPLDVEQRARLVEIADKCPVHRTLHGDPEVVTHLSEGPLQS
ncbi:MAG: OsmC family protein [Deltaproteobacteria bacterium]|nr:OsmC family protein [Deltaproteobacteria bacterium]